MVKREKQEDALDLALRRSVEQVRSAMPALIEERNALMERLAELNTKLGAASSFLSTMQGTATSAASTISAAAGAAVQPPPQRPVGKRAAGGAVYAHVHAVLVEAGKMKQVVMHDELEKKFGTRYGHSSVWRALASGRDRGLYRNTEDGYWHITAKGKAVDPEKAKETA